MATSNLIIADFSIVPVGHGETSVGRYIAAVIKEFDAIEGLQYEVTPMGTVLASEKLDTILLAVRKAHETVFAKGIKRVESTLRIDDRRDKARLIDDKVRAVNEYKKELTGEKSGVTPHRSKTEGLGCY